MSMNTVFIPTTLGYKKNSLQDQSKMLLLGSVLGAVTLLLVGWVLIFSRWGVISRLVWGITLYLGVFLLVRYVLLGEYQISKYYSKVMGQDYRLDAKDFWGIFSVDTVEPYMCRFRSGTMGVFVMFDKDVLVGKGEEVYTAHEEALAEALRYANTAKIRMIHVDYMSSKGEDDRIPQLYVDLNGCESDDLRDLCVQIYSHLEDSLLDTQSVYDVYMFSYRGSEAKFFDSLDTLIDLFMEANYAGFRFLNSDDIRQLAEDIFNLEDFSVADARREAFSTYTSKGGKDDSGSIIPIAVTDNGKEVTLNKTLAQKREEARLKEEYNKALADEKKRRKESGEKSKKSGKIRGRHTAVTEPEPVVEDDGWLDDEIKLF